MKTYSIPRQIWRAIKFPLLYLLIQFVVSFAATFVFGIMQGIEQAKSGITIIDQAKLTEATQDFINQNTMLILLISGIICLIIFYLTWNKERKDLDKNISGLTPICILSILFLGITVNFVISGVIELTGIINLFPSYETVENLVISGRLPLRILSIGILAPIVEELCFRGIVYNRLRRSTSFLPAMIISSILFGIVHLNILQGLYATILGIVLVLIYNKFKTIYAPIILHLSFNLLSVIMSIIPQSDTTSESNLSSILILTTCIIFTVIITKFISNQKITIEKQEHSIDEAVN